MAVARIIALLSAAQEVESASVFRKKLDNTGGNGAGSSLPTPCFESIVKKVELFTEGGDPTPLRIVNTRLPSKRVSPNKSDIAEFEGFSLSGRIAAFDDGREFAWSCVSNEMTKSKSLWPTFGGMYFDGPKGTPTEGKHGFHHRGQFVVVTGPSEDEYIKVTEKAVRKAIASGKNEIAGEKRSISKLKFTNQTLGLTDDVTQYVLEHDTNEDGKHVRVFLERLHNPSTSGSLFGSEFDFDDAEATVEV